MRTMSLLVLAATVLAGCADERVAGDAGSAGTQAPQEVSNERAPPVEATVGPASNTPAAGALVATPPAAPGGTAATPVTDQAGGKAVLLMETDGKGDDARVTEWRVGVPPEVDYVEGCS